MSTRPVKEVCPMFTSFIRQHLVSCWSVEREAGRAAWADWWLPVVMMHVAILEDMFSIWEFVMERVGIPVCLVNPTV